MHDDHTATTATDWAETSRNLTDYAAFNAQPLNLELGFMQTINDE